MAKQNLSKKGVERFRKKKTPKNERRHKKVAAVRAPGGSPAGGKALGTRSLLRKNKLSGDKRNRGDRKKKKTAAELAMAAGNGSGRGVSPQGYVRTQKILLVGEGNLSMARALLRLFKGDGRNIVATTFDTEEELKEKYAESAEILEELTRGGVVTAFGVDATNLCKHLRLVRKQWREAASAREAEAAAEAAAAPAADGDDEMEDGAEGGAAPPTAPLTPPPVPEKFDRVVFNFPHRALGIKDQDANVRANQQLLHGFFRCAVDLLAPEGEVRVTLKAGLPYSLWNAPKLAVKASGRRLALRTALVFNHTAFPGYAHRRTHGDGPSRPNAEEMAGGARTYCWREAIPEPAAAATPAATPMVS